MDLQLLEQWLADRGEPAFRARQVWAWVARGAGGYEQMTDLPAALREALAREVPFTALALREEAHARDGTVKALFETVDGRPLEAVLMRYRDTPQGTRGRRSICLSSQSGCPLTCRFCATGQMRFARNLSASEILEQALHFARAEREAGLTEREAGQDVGPAERGAGLTKREAGRDEREAGRDEREAGRDERGTGVRRRGTSPDVRRADLSSSGLSNCVFMGMGEPMLNLDAVLEACTRLPDLGITHRRTTISTVGWIPGIERLAESDMPVRLALSLHAAEESLRSELMPVNDRYPLRDVLAACRAFYERRHRRVFVEYVMLAGVNDRYEQALALARALREGRTHDAPSIFKVNLIPYNPGPVQEGEEDPFRGSGREAIAAFKEALEARGVPATVRLTRGRDIAAACGQLAATAADC